MDYVWVAVQLIIKKFNYNLDKDLFTLSFLASGARERNPGGKETNKNKNKMRKEHIYYIYILTSERNGTLYIGVTNNLFSRIFIHKLKENQNSFTAKYGVGKLVYYEEHQYIQDAIEREKQMKKWKREWKIKLIEKINPSWRDLFKDME